jgi:hypothetical protein
MRVPILQLVGFGSFAWLLLSAGTTLATGSEAMEAKLDAGTGQILITDAGKPVLRYNYRSVEPGDRLNQIRPENLKYARARSDYIHPLYGLDGQELTLDWPVDHPHHRGIYWAWPEVDCQGERGDLHALQRVYARPTEACRLQGGAGFAQIEATNLWWWEDKQPIVREQVLIRAFREGPSGRNVDLEFHFSALQDNVAIARRGTELYGGLNIRLASVKDQQIFIPAEAVETKAAKAWATLSGQFLGSASLAALTILQSRTNPDYPGDWVKYPELNWVQPTFPAAKSRFSLRKDQPLVLRYRLWIQAGGPPTAAVAEEAWRRYDAETTSAPTQ